MVIIFVIYSLVGLFLNKYYTEAVSLVLLPSADIQERDLE